MDRNILTNDRLRRQTVLVLGAITLGLIGASVVSYFAGLNPVSPVVAQAKSTILTESSPTPGATETPAQSKNLYGGKAPLHEIKLKEISYDDFMVYLRSSQVLKNAATPECLQSAQFCPKRVIVRALQDSYADGSGCATSNDTLATLTSSPLSAPPGSLATSNSPAAANGCTYLDVALKTDDGRLLPIGTLVNDKPHLNANYIEGLAFIPVSGFGSLGVGNLSDLRMSERFAIDAASFYLLQLN